MALPIIGSAIMYGISAALAVQFETAATVTATVVTTLTVLWLLNVLATVTDRPSSARYPQPTGLLTTAYLK